MDIYGMWLVSIWIRQQDSYSYIEPKITSPAKYMFHEIFQQISFNLTHVIRVEISATSKRQTFH